MEVLTPPANNDPSAPVIAPEDPATAAQSPRTRRLVSFLLQRVLSLNRRAAQAQDQSLGTTAAATATEITVSVRKFPYSAVERNPGCPYVFQMPLHYPRFTKEEYESMPEWQLDRLLEEYGVPVCGTLEDKREYAIGAFLWRS